MTKFPVIASSQIKSSSKTTNLLFGIYAKFVQICKIVEPYSLSNCISVLQKKQELEFQCREMFISSSQRQEFRK